MTEHRPLELDHIGFVVEDLELGKRRMSALGGWHWTAPAEFEGRMPFRGRVLPWRVRVCYSVEGPVHIELIQQLESTGFDTIPDGQRAHHVAFVSRDLVADVERCERLGLTREFGPIGVTGRPEQFSYHRSVADGTMIEILSSGMQDALRAWADSLGGI